MQCSLNGRLIASDMNVSTETNIVTHTDCCVICYFLYVGGGLRTVSGLGKWEVLRSKVGRSPTGVASRPEAGCGDSNSVLDKQHILFKVSTLGCYKHANVATSWRSTAVHK